MRIDRQALSPRVFARSIAAAALLSVSLISVASSFVLIDVGGGRGTAWIGPEHPVEWHLNTTRNDATIANEFTILRESWRAWDERVADVDLEFVEGSTTAGAVCGLQADGINNLSMTDCLSQCTGSCLAVTSTIIAFDGYWNPNTVSDTILVSKQESDITWAAGRNWEDYRDWPPCPNGSFDLWGVSIHEMGHFLGLGHSINSFATMFFAIAPCDSTKASLHLDDKRGTRVLYRPGQQVAAATLNSTSALLTVTNKGNVGFTGSGGKVGDSFQWSGTGAAENIWEASFAIAQVNGPVSDNFREEIAEPGPGGDADFEQTSPLLVSAPGAIVAEEATATFDDHRAEAPYGVEITSNFYADDSAGNEDFVICEYIIENPTGSTLNNMRAGMFLDVDFNDQFALNSVNYDAARSLAYVTTPNTSAVFGVAVLNEEGAVAMRALRASTATPAEDFTDANKQSWMSGAFAQTTLGPDDIALMIATGNFSIPSGGRVNTAFAMIGGSNLADLQANADAARTLYQTVIKIDPSGVGEGHPVLPVALGPATPNPFQGTTRLEYTLYAQSPVRIDVLDASGRIVRSLVDEQQGKGTHTLSWNGTDSRGNQLPSGVYFTRVLTNGREQTRKLHMIR